MSDEILCSINGTKDVGDFDLDTKKLGFNVVTHTLFPHHVDNKIILYNITYYLLTGRSLDILCSCLILWLRELCGNNKTKCNQQNETFMASVQSHHSFVNTDTTILPAL